MNKESEITFSNESLDKIAQSIYDFDCTHRGYLIEWDELEEHIQSEYLLEAEYTIEAVLEELGMENLLDDKHIKHLAEALYKRDAEIKGYRIDFMYLSQETQDYYTDLAKVASDTIYHFYARD